MSIDALIQGATEKGVLLCLVNGQLKYAGRREAVNELLEPLRQHKAELIHRLQAANDRLSIERNSEGMGGGLGLDNRNRPVETTAEPLCRQSATQRKPRQRGPWLVARESIAAKEYHTHHFKCATCIAAGRGSWYGQRCDAGMALWRAYCD